MSAFNEVGQTLQSQPHQGMLHRKHSFHDRPGARSVASGIGRGIVYRKWTKDCAQRVQMSGDWTILGSASTMIGMFHCRFSGGSEEARPFTALSAQYDSMLPFVEPSISRQKERMNDP